MQAIKTIPFNNDRQFLEVQDQLNPLLARYGFPMVPYRGSVSWLAGPGGSERSTETFFKFLYRGRSKPYVFGIRKDFASDIGKLNDVRWPIDEFAVMPAVTVAFCGFEIQPGFGALAAERLAKILKALPDPDPELAIQLDGHDEKDFDAQLDTVKAEADLKGRFHHPPEQVTMTSSNGSYHVRLKEILCEKSVKRGEFTLASGKKSDYYLDCRQTTLDAEGALCTGMAVLELVRTLEPQPKAVGGPTLGADPIVAAVAALSAQDAGPKVSAFIIRKETKQHGMQQMIEGWRGTEGDPVVIVEDTCTTGGSAVKAIEQAKAVGLKVVAAVCVVDREEGDREAIEKHCPFYALFTARELLAET